MSFREMKEMKDSMVSIMKSAQEDIKTVLSTEGNYHLCKILHGHELFDSKEFKLQLNMKVFALIGEHCSSYESLYQDGVSLKKLTIQVESGSFSAFYSSMPDILNTVERIKNSISTIQDSQEEIDAIGIYDIYGDIINSDFYRSLMKQNEDTFVNLGGEDTNSEAIS